MSLLLLRATAPAQPDVSGGVQAPSASPTGGSEYGARARASPLARPVVSALSLPTHAAAGRPPRVALRIDEAGVGTVEAR